MKKKDTFLRVEKKYKMTKEQYENFVEKIKDFMTMDEYGKHTISNIYYDTEDFTLIRRSIDKPVFKEKIRLRSYGKVGENENVFLEIKRKVHNIVYKRRVMMTYKEAQNYMNNKIKPKKETTILKEIDYFTKIYKLQEAVFIAYDRIAFFGNEDNELRLTIDSDLRSRTQDKGLLSKYPAENFFEEDTYLMEIKLEGGMPLWLSKILNEEKIYPTSFSKYGNIYKKMLASQGNRAEKKSA